MKHARLDQQAPSFVLQAFMKRLQLLAPTASKSITPCAEPRPELSLTVLHRSLSLIIVHAGTTTFDYRTLINAAHPAGTIIDPDGTATIILRTIMTAACPVGTTITLRTLVGGSD
jgi:hypothetical protein